MFKHYIFDLDGTLIDSMPKATNTLLSYLDSENIKYPKDLIKKIVPLGYDGIAKYFVEELGVNKLPNNVFNDLLSRLQKMYAHEVQPKAGADETLRTLKKRGATVNLLTASPHAFVDPCIQRLGWWEVFDNVWTVEDFACSKADPGIYKEASQRLSTSLKECVMLDDSVNSLKSAKDSGITVIGVYDDFSAPYEKEMRTIGDRYVYNLKELLDIE